MLKWSLKKFKNWAYIQTVSLKASSVREGFFLMKHVSSSAVQEEPTQSPIQSHSSGHSPLCNRLSAHHHWRPPPGWILWSHCERLCTLFLTMCFPLVKEISQSYRDLSFLSEFRPNRAGPHYWDPCLPTWNLPPPNSLLRIEGLPRLLL